MASLFQRNKKIILARDEFCAICGEYVNKELKTPHPMSPEVDHITPLAAGGTDALDNLQLTHRCCNREKSDKLNFVKKKKKKKRSFEQLINF